MASLFICGDIVNYNSGLNFVGDNLKQKIFNADYAVCNLEGPEIEKGQELAAPHQEPGTIKYLQSIGFNLMLLANNHITELGAQGLKHSIHLIKQAGIDYVGAGLSWEETYRPVVREIKGIRFGFINICEAQVGQYLSPSQTYGYAWLGYEKLMQNINSLAGTTDYVITFVHAGLEHYDIPLPEIRNFYKKLCDNGVAIVIGGHPHCAQGYEYYNEKLIVYSLGNFYFPFRNEWPNECHSYSIHIEIAKNKAIKVKPLFHYNNGQEVELEEEGIVNIETLNKKIGENYETECKFMIINAYEYLCKNLLIDATCGQNESDSLKQIIERVVCYTIFRKKYVRNNLYKRNKLLLRLFENETYRYCIIRYLKENTKL